MGSSSSLFVDLPEFEKNHSSGSWDWNTTADPIKATLAEDEDVFSLRVQLPSVVDRSSVKLEVFGNQLSIFGERKQHDPDVLYANFTSFDRSILLPSIVDPSTVEGSWESGPNTLVVKMKRRPRHSDAKRLFIPVNGARHEKPIDTRQEELLQERFSKYKARPTIDGQRREQEAMIRAEQQIQNKVEKAHQEIEKVERAQAKSEHGLTEKEKHRRAQLAVDQEGAKERREAALQQKLEFVEQDLQRVKEKQAESGSSEKEKKLRALEEELESASARREAALQQRVEFAEQDLQRVKEKQQQQQGPSTVHDNSSSSSSSSSSISNLIHKTIDKVQGAAASAASAASSAASLASSAASGAISVASGAATKAASVIHREPAPAAYPSTATNYGPSFISAASSSSSSSSSFSSDLSSFSPAPSSSASSSSISSHTSSVSSFSSASTSASTSA